MNKDKNLEGNEEISKAIALMYQDLTDENLAHVLTLVRRRMNEEGHFVVAVNTGLNDMLALRPVKLSDGKRYFATFTDLEEEIKGKDKVVSGFTAGIREIFEMALNSEDIDGVILNPWDKPFKMDKELIKIVIC